MKEKEFWNSKKWWVGVVGVLVPVANAIFGWGLSVEEVLQALAPLFAYILGQGMADFAKNRADGTLPPGKPFWQSKKFLTAVVGSLVPLLNGILELNLDPQLIYGLVGSSSAYVAGQGLADFGKNAAAEPASG